MKTFFKHFFLWLMTFVILVMAVCDDLRPGDHTFHMIGNIGLFLFWTWMIVAFLGAASELICISKDEVGKKRVHTVYLALFIVRWILADVWLAAYGHFGMAAAYFVVQTTIWIYWSITMTKVPS